MRRFRILGLTASLMAPAVSFAQTQQKLDSAVAMYEAFNIEAARPILLNIISPNYLLQVTNEQKVTAFKYLGASYAVLEKPDTAVQFFVAALDLNPFTDLDPAKFSDAERNAFARAKASIFKVAVKPIDARIIDPHNTADTASYLFRLITTRRANDL